jgi:phage-related tail protein
MSLNIGVQVNPDLLDKRDIIAIGKFIESYVEEQNRIMVIPEELDESSKKRFKESKKIVDELIDNLKKGKRKVFNNADEWNFFE